MSMSLQQLCNDKLIKYEYPCTCLKPKVECPTDVRVYFCSIACKVD